jgi:molybdopterin-guanine dinucleotide biosynthesis protein A
MGAPKAELLVDGTPMAVRVADAARAAGASAVAAVGSPIRPAEHVVEDDPGAGPLGAVLAALRWAGGDDVLVLSCDLVAPSAAAMRTLVDELGADGEVDVAVPVASGRAQWLHGAWRSSAATVEAVRAAYDGGERSVRGAVRALRVREVEVPDAAPYADADRPEDLPPGSGPGSGTVAGPG